ncbi:uncharacterized protein KGF55_002084 [Candida pseudojiufengensis]|uniref:uncharacterized protein n=1 Tax=Candida pseudojiufengensis TaxID=497109 RepID=UPI002224013B|nr:uncharacterized protein KGF55_002084 [Candida pseudojiufengensis]KAI5964142.1 hypothetical protein KGF55_002084 [Candida pseudojiufengensis]
MFQVLLRQARSTKPTQLNQQLRFLTKYSKNPQIIIHENPPNHFNFSLSSKPNALTIGSSTSNDPKPENFQINNNFKELLEKTLSTKIYNDFTFIMEASTNGDSFMPIYDFREIPEYSRRPYIENVFGYVQVDKSGKIKPETWQKNDMYQICSGKSGLPKFTEYLYETLQEECEK